MLYGKGCRKSQIYITVFQNCEQWYRRQVPESRTGLKMQQILSLLQNWRSILQCALDFSVVIKSGNIWINSGRKIIHPRVFFQYRNFDQSISALLFRGLKMPLLFLTISYRWNLMILPVVWSFWSIFLYSGWKNYWQETDSFPCSRWLFWTYIIFADSGRDKTK